MRASRYFSMAVAKLTPEEIIERILSFLAEDRIWTRKELWRRIQYAAGYEVSFALEDLQFSGIIENGTETGYPIAWDDIVILK